VFENRLLRRIFGPKNNEVTGKWRKLHNEELRDFHSSPSITVIRHRWVDNLGEVGWGDLGWNGLAQDRNRWRALINSVLNLRVP
jgi:hypothetical protein